MLTGLLDSGQLYDVCTPLPVVVETLEILGMRSYQHDVGSHAELPAGCARNRVTRKHVCNANSLDVLWPSGEDILDKLKENSIETSWVVMLGTGWRTR
jgi:hypothetical protein